MLLWTLIFLGLDHADRRTVWRDYWIDWAARRRRDPLPPRRRVVHRPPDGRHGAASWLMVPQLVSRSSLIPLVGADRAPARPLAAGAMKRNGCSAAVRRSPSRAWRRPSPGARFVLGALQGGVGVLLAGRLGYLSIAENERYRGLAEEQPGPDPPDPAAARLDRRPQRQADRDQPHRLPRRPHPRRSRGPGADCSPTLAQLLALAARRGRSASATSSKAARATSRCQVAETSRLRAAICRGHRAPARAARRRRRCAASRASIPTGAGGRPSDRLCRRRLGRGI